MVLTLRLTGRGASHKTHWIQTEPIIFLFIRKIYKNPGKLLFPRGRQLLYFFRIRIHDTRLGLRIQSAQTRIARRQPDRSELGGNRPPGAMQP